MTSPYRAETHPEPAPREARPWPWNNREFCLHAMFLPFYCLNIAFQIWFHVKGLKPLFWPWSPPISLVGSVVGLTTGAWRIAQLIRRRG